MGRRADMRLRFWAMLATIKTMGPRTVAYTACLSGRFGIAIPEPAALLNAG